ncbi:MFS transporter [Streptomyces sp. NPDC059906]|uniref:MFS transporter n=1 Tax=Streptomyces sp. NPDC059906 TaxID=3346997 RepID=UPI00364D3313
MTSSDAAERRKGGLLSRLLLPDPAARVLSVWAFLTTLGTGMFAAGGVVYFVEGVGLSSHEVALGLTISGLLALGVGIPVGHLADRVGPRTLCIVTLLLRSAGTLVFLIVQSFPTFLAAAVLVACADVGGGAAGGAMIAGYGGTDRVRLRAYLHSVTNLGVAGGALLSGVFIAADTESSYRMMILGVAVSPVAAALALLRTPRLAPVPTPEGAGRWDSLRDRRYVVVTALHALLSLHFEVLTFAVPLWLIASDVAPTWLVSALLVINTAMVVLFQVPASRGVTSVRTAALVGRRSGGVLLLACAVIGAAGNLSAPFAIGCFLLGTVLLTLGELFQSASSFGLSFDLAPDHAQGQYQGVFALGRGTAKAIAPALLAVPCVQWGLAGWIAVGGGLALTGLLLPLATRSAAAAPEREEETAAHRTGPETAGPGPSGAEPVKEG